MDVRNKNMLILSEQRLADNISVGKYSYYSLDDDPDTVFDRDVVHYNYPGHGSLKIGSFVSIAVGVEIIMGAANHATDCFSSFPFNQVSLDWARWTTIEKKDMPDRGDTIIGNDVWIGRQATIMPGVRIGDGAIIGAHAVVAKDVPAYAVVVGNPAKVVRFRFEDETIEFLEALRWWDFSDGQLDRAIPYLTSLDLDSSRDALLAIKAGS